MEEKKIDKDVYEYDESGAILLPLSKPFKTMGETVTVLRIAAPTGKHLRAMWRVAGDGTDVGQMAYLAALCGVHPKELDDMCAKDVMAITKAVDHLGG